MDYSTQITILTLPREHGEYVLPRHPAHGFNSLMKYMRKYAAAPILILHRADEKLWRSMAFDTSDHGSEFSPEPPGRTQTSSDQMGSASQISFFNMCEVPSDDDAASSISEDSALSDRWTASEFARGFRHRDSTYSSESGISAGSGNKSSVSPDCDSASLSTGDAQGESDLLLQYDIRPPSLAGNSPHLSIFCVGFMPDITSLIVSSLYQRRTWGIQTPVVGLAYHKAVPIVQVLLGWLLEVDELNSGNLVRIAK